MHVNQGADEKGVKIEKKKKSDPIKRGAEEALVRCECAVRGGE